MSAKTWTARIVTRPITAEGHVSDNRTIAHIVSYIILSFGAAFVILGMITSFAAVIAFGPVALLGLIIVLETRPKKEMKFTEEISIEEEDRKMGEEHD